MAAVFDLAEKIVKLLSGDKKMKLFTIPKALLNFLGFNWFKGGIGLPVPSFIKYALYRVFYVLELIVVSILTLHSAYTTTVTTQYDFIRMINCVIVSMTFCASALKATLFTIKRKELITLMNNVQQLGYLDGKDPQLKAHIIITLIYVALVCSNALSWSAGFLLLHRDVPFSTSYPWESKGYSFFPTIFFDFIAGSYCALCHSLVESTFMLAAASISIHVDSLCEVLARLGSRSSDDQAYMLSCLQHHIQLLRVAKEVSDCFSNLFVAQSVYTVSHSCVLLFGAINVDNKFEVMLNQGTMLVTSYMQLLVYCYYGELMTSKFKLLLFASYNNSWYNCSLTVKKNLILFSLMTHRHISLRGFGNVHPSHSNWLHSLQDSVSYFLFLKTVSGGE